MDKPVAKLAGRILLVDDNTSSRFFTAKVLIKAGYEVQEAETGQEALAKAAGIPDLILLDVNLPDLSGFEVCAQLRANPRTTKILIVHLTAEHPDSESRVKGLEGGADGYLTHPIEPAVLIATVRALLRARMAEEALRASEERFRALYEEAGIGIGLISAAGELLQTNRTMREMFGYSAEELSHFPFARLIHEDAQEDFRKNLQGMASETLERVAPIEGKYVRKNGEIFWGRQNTSVIHDPKGAFLYAVGMIDDITKEIQGQKEKEDLQGRLVQAQKMEAVGTLAGGIAHDFNNILTAIQGYCDLAIMNAGEDQMLLDDLKEIRFAADRAAGLTQELLLFSRKQAFQPGNINLNSVILKFKRILTRIIGEDIEIKLELSPTLWTTFADTGNIEQVIMNLAVNSRNAMPSGGVLTIRTENVDPAPARSETDKLPTCKSVLMSVVDNGKGMAPEVQSRIFEPFFTTQDVGKGTGLGLSVVYGILQQHNAQITVNSSPGAGATFRIYFPAVTEAAEDSVEMIESTEKLKGRGERILVIEDEENIRVFLEKLLEKNGYSVILAPNRQEALKIFEARSQEINLVLSDVILPDGNGVQILDEFLNKQPQLKAILCSGYTDDKSQRLLIEKRKFPFIPKPFRIQSLLKIIADTLAGRSESHIMPAELPPEMSRRETDVKKKPSS